MGPGMGRGRGATEERDRDPARLSFGRRDPLSFPRSRQVYQRFFLESVASISWLGRVSKVIGEICYYIRVGISVGFPDLRRR